MPLSLPGPRSKEAYRKALALFPGGVNSPVRAFKGVGGEPFFVARGEGCRVFDVDGNAFIDYVGSWGPLLLGHADGRVVRAVEAAARKGLTFGAPTEAETALGEAIRRVMPSMERMRFVSSGTEAAMAAIRLARGATKRDLVLKFEGCYHGHSDALLVKAGSGLATFGAPSSAGVPADFARWTAVLPYNDLAACEALFAGRGREIACVILEPVAANMGVVLPAEGFLQGLRRLCNAAGALLVFDEVITGFRAGPGGAQGLLGVRPDLSILGKIVGGGMPIGAYGGRADLMALVSPEGPVYQAGTLSGNPLSVAAGLATLEILEATKPWDDLERKGARLEAALADGARAAGVPLAIARSGSLLGFFFSAKPPRNFTEVLASDAARYSKFFHACLDRGVYFAPSAFEAAFISTAHGEVVLERTAKAVGEAFREI
ncbi:MAG: glutamate-1-semialdehyde 2,1-aminomutase [Planctomycetota bacterium]